MPLREDFTNVTPNEDTHPTAHNATNDVVNGHTDAIAALQTQLFTIQSQLGADPGGTYANVQERQDVRDLDAALRGVGTAIHGAVAGTARPAGFRVIIWFGTVQPNNWQDGDIYVDLAP